jgi:hypothetical protein
MPWSAWFLRTMPSKSKGRVTTPPRGARGSNSRAIWATTGAEPVPVPPPMPAVIKTMSAPVMTSNNAVPAFFGGLTAQHGVAADAQPFRDAFAQLKPHRRFVPAQGLAESVLAVMNSTWESPASIMRLTALPPAPPSPMILMDAGCSLKSSLNLI